MKLRGLFTLVGAIAIGVAIVSASCGGQAPEPAPTPKPKTYSSPPPMVIDTSKQYIATIETEKGNLVLELFAKDVPLTVNNFVFLAREGFYNGSTFHQHALDGMHSVFGQLIEGTDVLKKLKNGTKIIRIVIEER